MGRPAQRPHALPGNHHAPQSLVREGPGARGPELQGGGLPRRRADRRGEPAGAAGRRPLAQSRVGRNPGARPAVEACDRATDAWRERLRTEGFPAIDGDGHTGVVDTARTLAVDARLVRTDWLSSMPRGGSRRHRRPEPSHGGAGSDGHRDDRGKDGRRHPERDCAALTTDPRIDRSPRRIDPACVS